MSRQMKVKLGQYCSPFSNTLPRSTLTRDRVCPCDLWMLWARGDVVLGQRWLCLVLRTASDSTHLMAHALQEKGGKRHRQYGYEQVTPRRRGTWATNRIIGYCERQANKSATWSEQTHRATANAAQRTCFLCTFFCPFVFSVLNSSLSIVLTRVPPEINRHSTLGGSSAGCPFEAFFALGL